MGKRKLHIPLNLVTIVGEEDSDFSYMYIEGFLPRSKVTDYGLTQDGREYFIVVENPLYKGEEQKDIYLITEKPSEKSHLSEEDAKKLTRLVHRFNFVPLYFPSSREFRRFRGVIKAIDQFVDELKRES